MLRRQIAFGAITAVIVGCSADTPAPTALELRAPIFVKSVSDMNLGTHLTGDEEVLAVAPDAPHPRHSRAQGQAIFRVNETGTRVDFRLIATNIDNAFMAHIHCGRFGSNGPVRMWLYPVPPPPAKLASTGTPGPLGSGRHAGVLSSDSFDPTGVSCPATATDPAMSLLDAMRAGITYVNVHTNDGVAPSNTGPGDFPGGEIRGQIDDENN